MSKIYDLPAYNYQILYKSIITNIYTTNFATIPLAPYKSVKALGGLNRNERFYLLMRVGYIITQYSTNEFFKS